MVIAKYTPPSPTTHQLRLQRMLKHLQEHLDYLEKEFPENWKDANIRTAAMNLEISIEQLTEHLEG